MHYRVCMLYEWVFNLVNRRSTVRWVNEPQKVDIRV